MERNDQVMVVYEVDGVTLRILGTQVGQLAVVRSHLFNPTFRMWHEKQEPNWWDLIHIKSNGRLDTLECEKGRALNVAAALSGFDFDGYWQKVKAGIDDPHFAKMVKYEIARWMMSI